MLDAICLDIEDDDPTWKVERKGSGAVEGKLTFLRRTMDQSLMIKLDILWIQIPTYAGKRAYSIMIVVSESAGLKPRLMICRSFPGGAGSEMDNRTSGRVGGKECRDLNQLNESKEGTIPQKS
jgi:hypothetical protein